MQQRLFPGENSATDQVKRLVLLKMNIW